ncbi:MAG: patatin-like phospholipase family protein [Parasphingorhabdus sp.]|uniref:patatin-like phospholipase family protein n=1 Tax=Parasphingorhabdus sp. TaxID=2709688 RepID=UPI00329A5B73
MALLISGCATRGPMELSCKGWKENFVQTLPPSELVQTIQSGGGVEKSTRNEPANIFDGNGFPADGNRDKGSFYLGSALLLSGGGQWGAFGTGVIDQLACPSADHCSAYEQQPKPPFDNLSIVTGVSTGGLQALFVAAGDYKGLVDNYTIVDEADIVDRDAVPFAALTGSVAGLGPLKTRIEEALCNNGNPEDGCPLIERLKKSERIALIGFVDGSTGQFQYVNTNWIAKESETLGDAQQCLTAAALSSAAMPTFFQQIKVEGQTYFDGGVRKSLFDVRLVNDLAAKRNKVQKGLGAVPDESSVYVIRNGPTVPLKGHDLAVDGSLDALSAALKAYSTIVNEIEVQSIATLRLERPNGGINLISADGFGKPFQRPDAELTGSGCTKLDDGTMFDRKFMACLMDFGRHKAKNGEWIPLPEVAAVK